MVNYEKANITVAEKYFNRQVLFDVIQGERVSTSGFTYEEFSKQEVVNVFAAVVEFLTVYG